MGGTGTAGQAEAGAVIAIDGPAASGESTVARRVAAALGRLYVDSGAVYRGVTWAALRRGLDPRDEAALERLAAELSLEVVVDGAAVRVRYDGEDPGPALRGAEVTAQVSAVAALPAVRRRVTDCLRAMARLGPLVMEGRDIGSAVFPEAACKFYLDAAPEERARRRHLESGGQAAGPGVRQEVERLRQRDALDSGRRLAPLRVAPGAVRVDTTAMSIEQVVEFILRRIPGAAPQAG